MSDTASIHIDGAARGNPGPAAFAMVIARPDQPPVEHADTIGTATNNVAEYTALVRALERAAELGLKKIAIFSDSELLVKQMAGEYRVKSEDLRGLYDEANRLRNGFESVTITHVRREQNKRADALCNEALDGKRGASTGLAPGRGHGPSGSSGPASRGSRSGTPGSSDAAVREEALVLLRSAAREWAERGVAVLPVEAVWDQLWSVLEEAGILKSHKGK